MMNILVSRLVGVALLATTPSVPALAQQSAAVAIGMQVTDSGGSPVGTVTGLNGANLLLKTDKHEVLLPKSSFTASGGKLLFGMTQAQLNAEIEKTASAASAALVAGATVTGLQGTPVGVIDKIDAGKATIKLAAGQSVTVPVSGLRGNANGTVTLGLTADQLKAAIDQAGAEGAGE
jgi:hypothetical protein